MTRRGSIKLSWRAAIWTGITLYVALSIVYLFWGQINDDEGWYLYASELVFAGDLPYRDFAFTQMPLLPYVYGLPQVLFSRSILVGRLTSVAFSIATLVLGLSLARRYAGEKGVAWEFAGDFVSSERVALTNPKSASLIWFSKRNRFSGLTSRCWSP